MGILLLAFFMRLIPSFLGRNEPAVVRVMQNGQETGVYPLWEDRTVSIPCEDEHYNFLFISNGRASVSDADCPDRLCVRARSISHNGESIICLPHKLVIQIESEEEGALDAVTY